MVTEGVITLKFGFIEKEGSSYSSIQMQTRREY